MLLRTFDAARTRRETCRRPSCTASIHQRSPSTDAASKWSCLSLIGTKTSGRRTLHDDVAGQSPTMVGGGGQRAEGFEGGDAKLVEDSVRECGAVRDAPRTVYLIGIPVA